MRYLVSSLGRLNLYDKNVLRSSRYSILSIICEIDNRPELIVDLPDYVLTSLQKILNLTKASDLFCPEAKSKVERLLLLIASVDQECCRTIDERMIQLTNYKKLLAAEPVSNGQQRVVGAQPVHEQPHNGADTKTASLCSDSDSVAKLKDYCCSDEKTTELRNALPKVIFKLWNSGMGITNDAIEIETFYQKQLSLNIGSGNLNEVYILPYETFICPDKNEERFMLTQTGLLIPVHLCDRLFSVGKKSFEIYNALLQMDMKFRRYHMHDRFRYLTMTTLHQSHAEKAVEFLKFVLKNMVEMEYSSLLCLCYANIKRSITGRAVQLSTPISMGDEEENDQQPMAGGQKEKCLNGVTDSGLLEQMKSVEEMFGREQMQLLIKTLVKKKKFYAQQPERRRITIDGARRGRFMGRFGCIATIIEHLTDVCLVFEKVSDRCVLSVRTVNDHNCRVAMELVQLIADGTVKMGRLVDAIMDKHFPALNISSSKSA